MPPETNPISIQSKRGRRNFLLRLSWGGFGLCLATFFAAVLKFFLPLVSSRPSMAVQVGFPEDYQAGQVVYHRGHKLFVLRDGNGFMALSARCSHLGCMVVFNDDHHMFLCPCHGGKFDVRGQNIEGPPPRPLDALALRLDDNGFLVVNQDVLVKRIKGRVPLFIPPKT